MVLYESHYRVGIEAEELVEKSLVDLRYKIIRKRWKSRFGKIDIIAIHDYSLFVEVKSRKDYLTENIYETTKKLFISIGFLMRI
ncbi:MAG: YraN family protein [Candidatus Midichloria sp.]|nr:MAG: YraN family protein [Candidatus Midichloria sp.]